ncbi:uncharacterized protein [Temnothorax longispinosus]|uniref:uncharacterized protein isoform X2 n=1 Tax=Temnothorax longispinosus TaxID=300112 RepID=UPI003A995587
MSPWQGHMYRVGYVPPKRPFGPLWARICSVHFSQESFHQGRARKDPVKKRHLLPSAVPTLFLNCSEAPNVNKNAVAEPAEPNLKFNILRRKFPLVVNSERRIGSSNTTSSTTSHVVVEDNIVNISTPKGIHRSDVLLEVTGWMQMSTLKKVHRWHLALKDEYAIHHQEGLWQVCGLLMYHLVL